MLRPRSIPTQHARFEVTLLVDDDSRKETETAQLREIFHSYGLEHQYFYWVDLKLLTSSRITVQSGPFNRGQALHIAANSAMLYEENPLLFFCDADMLLTAEFFERCQYFPEPGKRAYSPVPFRFRWVCLTFKTVDSTYKGVDSAAINDASGLWRIYGFGMLCIYGQLDITRFTV